MKISENWLREWVNPSIDARQLANQLTMAGLEIESVDEYLTAFSGVVVARITEVSRHPKAEKLSLCRVDAGHNEVLNVVCGAENVNAGMLVALAKPGAHLPGIETLKESEIRGIQSQGMLCSSIELGLAEEAEGILELPHNLVPGQELNELLSGKDNILDVSLTPNRGDCLSIAGIAREVAVLNQQPVNFPDITAIQPVHDTRRNVLLNANASCSHYVGRIIQDININRQIPIWISERLQKSGVRSINAVVDITNYVMLELGQPMHAFDNDKLQGNIHVRFGKSGEKITLLDQQSCNLTDEVLVIADDTNVLALAGIMGGLESAVSDQTTSIFLESAYFDPVVISTQARNFGIHTDSSHRFERGVDFNLQQNAMERATQLILEVCGGEPGNIIEEVLTELLPVRSDIQLYEDEIERLLGIQIERDQVSNILGNLGMQISGQKGYWEVIPPSYRFDISIQSDLIEELARIYGYDNIPDVNPEVSLGFHDSQQDRELQRNICSLLVHRGYQEAITYSFVDKFMQNLLAPEADSIELANPIAADMAVMRASMWPGLIKSLLYNLNRQQARIRLFETGLIYQRKQNDILQEPAVGGVIYGNIYNKQWDRKDRQIDYYDAKSDVEEILAGCGFDLQSVIFRSTNHPSLHPGQSAEIYYGNQKIGLLGALHPGIQHDLEIPDRTIVFELYLSLFSKKLTTKYQKISKFPMVKRDLSIVLDEEISLSEVINCIKKTTTGPLINLELFDVYRGEGIDLGKKSLALGLTFQGSSSTLTDEEIESFMGAILTGLQNQLGGRLRE